MCGPRFGSFLTGVWTWLVPLVAVWFPRGLTGAGSGWGLLQGFNRVGPEPHSLGLSRGHPHGLLAEGLCPLGVVDWLPHAVTGTVGLPSVGVRGPPGAEVLSWSLRQSSWLSHILIPGTKLRARMANRRGLYLQGHGAPGGRGQLRVTHRGWMETG